MSRYFSPGKQTLLRERLCLFRSGCGRNWPLRYVGVRDDREILYGGDWDLYGPNTITIEVVNANAQAIVTADRDADFLVEGEAGMDEFVALCLGEGGDQGVGGCL